MKKLSEIKALCRDYFFVARQFLHFAVLKGKLPEFLKLSSRIIKSKDNSFFSKLKCGVLFFNSQNYPHNHQFFSLIINKYLKNHPGKISNILDLGCGFGDFAYFLDKSLDVQYTGIDFSQDIAPVWEIVSSQTNSRFYKNDVRGFVKKPMCFDLITCLNTIMYFEDYPSFLEDIFKNSKKSAEFIVSFSTPAKPPLSIHKHGPVRITKELFEREASRIGFKIEDYFEFPLSDGIISTYLMKK